MQRISGLDSYDPNRTTRRQRRQRQQNDDDDDNITDYEETHKPILEHRGCCGKVTTKTTSTTFVVGVILLDDATHPSANLCDFVWMLFQRQTAQRANNEKKERLNIDTKLTCETRNNNGRARVERDEQTNKHWRERLVLSHVRSTHAFTPSSSLSSSPTTPSKHTVARFPPSDPCKNIYNNNISIYHLINTKPDWLYTKKCFVYTFTNW